MATVDELVITIQTNAESAASSVDRLTQSLQSLSAASQVSSTAATDLSGLQSAVTTLTMQMSELINYVAEAGSALGNIGMVANESGERLRAISDSMSIVRENSDIFRGALEGMTEAAEGMSAADNRAAASLGNVTNNITNVNNRLPRVTENARETSNSVSRLRSAVSSLGNGLKKLATAPLRLAGSAISALGNKVKNAFHMITRVITYRLIRSALSSITQGVGESINALYAYSSAIKGAFASAMNTGATQVAYLRNTLATALAPAVEALIPLFVRITDAVAEFIDKIAQLIAALSGKTTYTQAIKYTTDYSGGLDKAAKSAAKAAKEQKTLISGFDELNRLNDKNDSSVGSGGSGTDYSKMFAEAPISDDILKKVEKLVELKDKLVDYFQPMIDGAKTLKDKIKLVWDNIKRAFFDTGYGKSIFDNLSDTAWSLLSPLNTFTSGTLDVLAATDLKPLAASLDEVTESLSIVAETIDEDFKKTFDDIIADVEEWALTTGLPAVLGVISAALVTISKVITVAGNALRKFWEATADMRRWLGEKFAQISDKLKGFITKVGDLIEKNGPKIEEIFENLGNAINDIWILISPIIDWIMESGILDIIGGVLLFSLQSLIDTLSMLSGVLSGVLDVLVGIATFDFDKIGEGFKKIWESISGFFFGIWNKITEFLPQVWEKIKEWWSNTTEKIRGFFSDAIQKIGEFFGNILKPVGDFFVDLWNTVTEKLSGLWENVSGWFSDAINSVGEFFTDLWGKLTDNDLVNWVKEKIDDIKSAIRAAKQWVIDRFEDIGKAISDWGIDIENFFIDIWNGIVSGFEAFINFFVKGINWIIKGLNKISFTLPDWVPEVGGMTFGINISEVSEVKLSRVEKVEKKAEGGFVGTGDLFYANEQGIPEYIGSFGNRTAVANNDQIVEGISNGVANALGYYVPGIINAIEENRTEVNIGDDEIARSAARGNSAFRRQTGQSLPGLA